jgi:hypothetical protein
VQGLRPGIRARVKPFTRAFKKAHEVEMKPNRERHAQQPAATAKKKHGNNGSNSGNSGSNSSNSDGNNGSKNSLRPYHDTSSQSSTPSQSRNYSRPILPPASWIEKETRDKRRKKDLCWRCGVTTELPIAQSIHG